jgi:beta-fructofuranosidase
MDRIFLPRPSSSQQKLCLFTSSPTWELEAIISISASCETVGFYLRHNKNFSIGATITFSPITETITLDRSASTPYADVNKCPEQGPFTLFTIREPQTGKEEQEKFRLHITSDGDILEVYANDRFALGTMVYSCDYDNNNGITAFATGAESSAFFEEVRIWDGLKVMQVWSRGQLKKTRAQ